MAIYVTGDTHGASEEGGFMRRFSESCFPGQRELTKEDCVVICGDFGGVWKTDRVRVRESPPEKEALDWLEARPFTTLFVPGNHENYDRLTGCDDRLLASWLYSGMPPGEKEKLRLGYPRAEWHGGFVRTVRPSVLMLERGEIYSIGGKHCFAFGGARSQDIRDGVLDPAEYPDEAAFVADYNAWRGRSFRVRGVSWWSAEMPSRDEMDRGRINVRAFLAEHRQIDFVFTHDAPVSDKQRLGFYETDELSLYLESLRREMRYGRWYFGHLHGDCAVTETDFLLYRQIVRAC